MTGHACRRDGRWSVNGEVNIRLRQGSRQCGPQEESIRAVSSPCCQQAAAIHGTDQYPLCAV